MTQTMTQLSVNVNKIATLRNARGHDLPNVVAVATDIIQFGAHGITVHPRPDERHIKKQDTFDLSELVKQKKQVNPSLEFNVEGYPSDDFLQLIAQTKPDQCTLVPDPPDVITSNAGWDLVKNKTQLQTVLDFLKQNNVRSSVFMDPADNNNEQFAALKELQPDRIELYTEAFAKSHSTDSFASVVQGYQQLAQEAQACGVELNAGHDLNLENLNSLIESLPQIKEVSIGHALICEALYLGLEETVSRYLGILKKGANNQ